MTYDAVIIGAGAAGLMCALTAGYAGRRVLVVDHAKRAGSKILMSGGGRCNFTHLASTPANFFSDNPHFCISALKRYRPEHFVELVERHGVEYVEKAPGQLFCADSAKEIVRVLLTECEWAGVEIRPKTAIERVERLGEGMRVVTSRGAIECGAVVVATGGLSIPTMGGHGLWLRPRPPVRPRRDRHAPGAGALHPDVAVEGAGRGPCRRLLRGGRARAAGR